MKRDSRLSGVLHVLLHMAEFDRTMTSERLALVMQTNPVIVRRIMGRLRDLGLVASAKGHGGGWRLCCDFNRVTLHDVYQALGAPEIFAMGHRSAEPACLVEQAVNAALATAFEEAERVLLSRLGDVTLEALSVDFNARLAKRQTHQQEARPDGA
ncbi:Rrf2 family transcriptional regulator [Methylobacterium sp. W2]|uniref:Rrf2 family transcriptional regulator n=1 Tax=Methylobacterium sp. W2 TaxID=2598107 RepID=UPI001D0C876F|nr:Rrf2 family transcriptional regulator [Methylobacterium sp. W2]MCC0809032.1 Rrf2 family transcriptional regulator [Methylobacterium sp. W2]